MKVQAAIIAAVLLFITGLADVNVSQDIDSKLQVARHDYRFSVVQSALQSLLKDGTEAAYYGAAFHWIMAAVMFLFCCCLGHGVSTVVALADLLVSAVVCYKCWIEGEKEYAMAELAFGIISAVVSLVHSYIAFEKSQKGDDCAPCCV